MMISRKLQCLIAILLATTICLSACSYLIENISDSTDEATIPYAQLDIEYYLECTTRPIMYWDLINLLEASRDKLYTIYAIQEDVGRKPENINIYYPGYHVNTPIPDLQFVVNRSTFGNSSEYSKEAVKRLPVDAIRLSGDIYFSENNIMAHPGDLFSEIAVSWLSGISGDITYLPILFSGYFESTEYKTYALRIYSADYVFEFYSGSANEPIYEYAYFSRGSELFNISDLANVSYGPSYRYDVSDCDLSVFRQLLTAPKDVTEKESYIERLFLPKERETFFSSFASNAVNTSDPQWPSVPINGMDVLYPLDETWFDNPYPAVLQILKGNMLDIGAFWSFADIQEAWGEPLYEGTFLYEQESKPSIYYQYMSYQQDGLLFVFAGSETTVAGAVISSQTFILLANNIYFDGVGKLVSIPE